MPHASGLAPPRVETLVPGRLRAAVLVAAGVVLAGCAGLTASPRPEPPSAQARARAQDSEEETRAPNDTRVWAVLSKAGREAKRMRNYGEAEEHFRAALALTDRLPPRDVRIRTTLGNLVELAALYHQEDRDEDAERLMAFVTDEVDSRDLAPFVETPFEDLYRSRIERPRRPFYSDRPWSMPRRRTARWSAADLSDPPTEHGFDELIARTARSYRIDPALVKAVVATESNFEIHAVSRVGAQGLMQLMPETARRLGVSAPFEPSQNLRGGVRYLREMLDRYGDTRLALAAYNAGPDAVDRHAGIPPYPETRAYVARVLHYYRGYRSEFAN